MTREITSEAILDKKIVLKLNKHWLIVDTATPRDIFPDLVTGATIALDIQGKGYAMPVLWEDWLKLPVRPEDFSIHTVSQSIRIPTVVICAKFDKLRTKQLKLSRRAVYIRDRGICQYSGEAVAYEDCSLDHVIPKSQGGKRTWDNIVLTSKVMNCRKNNRTPEEAGLTLLAKPRRPEAMLPSMFIRNDLQILGWDMFLK